MATESSNKMDSAAFAEQIAKELNTISWTVIPATDLARIQTFYGQVFGWQFDSLPAAEGCTQDSVQDSASKDSDLKPKDPMFIMFRFSASDTVPHGGFVQVSPENLLSPALHDDNAKKSRLSVCTTITVRSCDETLKKIVEAGGEVYMEKMLVPNNMGAIANFLDTEKNVMGLWSEN